MLTRMQTFVYTVLNLSYARSMRFSTALAHFKTSAAMARALEVSGPAITRWKHLDRVPKGRAYQLEKLTDGAIKVDLEVYGTGDSNPKGNHASA